MAQDLISADGEVLPQTTQQAVLDVSGLSAIVRAEIDTAIATARAYPRSAKRALDNITLFASLDEATAAECIYALNRGGKPIRGPSIRMAEIIAQQWGNNRVDARVVEIDRKNKVIVAEATFHDLETNSLTKASVQRRISGKNNQIYSDDMIVTTGNAACSIARRNAILGGVPKGIWAQGLFAAEQKVRGDAKTLTERRDVAVKAFAHFGMTPEQVLMIMHVKSVEEIGLDELVTLRGTFSALKNGETTVEEVVRIATGAPAQSDHKKIANPLSDEAPAEDDAAGNADSAPKAADDAKGPELSPVEIARQRGAQARASGLMRKAMPAEYRKADRKAEAEAWFEGYDAEGDKGGDL